MVHNLSHFEYKVHNITGVIRSYEIISSSEACRLSINNMSNNLTQEQHVIQA